MSNTVEKEESYFIQQWKSEMQSIIKMKYPDISKKKLDELLTKQVTKRLRNRSCDLYNNYKGMCIETNLISLVELIFRHNLIISGGGTLYIQHAPGGPNGMDRNHPSYNPIIVFVMSIMAERGSHKDLRDTYSKETFEWLMENLLQGNFKVKVNAWYGCNGYRGFFCFNIFNAEATTTTGQNIITTASMGFEDFLSDNNPLLNMNEVYHYLYNIKNEYKTNYSDMSFDYISDLEPLQVMKRLLRKCTFSLTQSEYDSLKLILENTNKNILKLFYYKNNFDEFIRLPFIADKLKFIMANTNVIMVPKTSTIKNPEVVFMIDDFWKFAKLFVFYNFPTYDRIRKGKYLNRKSVMYIDTDSNMISVFKWTKYIRDSILPTIKTDMSAIDARYTSVNIIALILSNVVAGTLHTLCKGMNITDEWAELLLMKNEYYFSRMLFVKTKKRYLASMKIQEGKLIRGGNGEPEIKGFDFKKAGTKPIIRAIYEDICEHDILAPDNIDVRSIYRKVIAFKHQIEDSLNNGETIYYKQASVGIIEQYKKPYSIQGIKGTILWNALFPQYYIELPMDVDIVPIKTFDNKINRANFQTKYPDIYDIIETTIMNCPNPDIAKMELNVIAKPKKDNLELPEWYYYLINKDKILDDAVNLFSPIMESLGVQSLETSSNKTKLTNIVYL